MSARGLHGYVNPYVNIPCRSIWWNIVTQDVHLHIFRTFGTHFVLENVPYDYGKLHASLVVPNIPSVHSSMQICLQLGDPPVSCTHKVPTARLTVGNPATCSCDNCKHNVGAALDKLALARAAVDICQVWSLSAGMSCHVYVASALPRPMNEVNYVAHMRCCCCCPSYRCMQHGKVSCVPGVCRNPVASYSYNTAATAHCCEQSLLLLGLCIQEFDAEHPPAGAVAAALITNY